MKKCQGTRKKDEKNALVPKTIIPQSAAVNIRDLYLFIALQMLIYMASGLQIPMNEAAVVNIRRFVFVYRISNADIHGIGIANHGWSKDVFSHAVTSLIFRGF